MSVKIDDLPEHYRVQAMRQLVGKVAAELDRRQPAAATIIQNGPARREPNKTEAEYRRVYIDTDPAASGVYYEGLTFRLAGGHRYTPDWVYWRDGVLTCVECKGGYRFASHGRARMAFDQARIEWPGVRWVWAVKGKAEWRQESQQCPFPASGVPAC